jgi:DNA repair exonuclease SbcCD ATPase subunit
MGQEHSWKGKHFLLCIAGGLSILLGLCGCAHLLNGWHGEQDLKDAKDLMRTGQYVESEKKTLNVLQAFPKTLGDEALFQMGLIYSSPRNPTTDFGKSRVFFERLVTQYPDSSRTWEADAWLFALNRLADHEKEGLELQEKVRLLEQTSESREHMLRQLQEQLKDKEREKEIAQHPEKKLKQLQENLEEREKEITGYLETVSQLQNRVMELESQLAKFKNIDLTIEKKKRGAVP